MLDPEPREAYHCHLRCFFYICIPLKNKTAWLYGRPHLKQVNSKISVSACFTFKVPPSTLSDYIRGKSQFGCKLGKETTIPKEYETELKKNAIDMSMMGSGMSRPQLMRKALSIAKEKHIWTPPSWDKNGMLTGDTCPF